jgi:hypothetical protein
MKLTPFPQSSLVGSRLPCENITNEYAKADPIYVEKTLVRENDPIRQSPERTFL